jgi:hypothetical protein
LLGEGHEYLSLMIPYDSYRPVMNGETVAVYDIMRGTYTSMKCTSSDVQALTLWSVEHQV